MTARTGRPRNVFLVANNIDELGGAQRVTHNLAVMLHEAGHRVTVVGINHAAVRHDYGVRPYPWLVLNETPEPPPPTAQGWRRRWDPRVRAAERRHERARQGAADRLSAVFGEVEDGIVVVMQIHSMEWVSRARTRHLRVVGMSHESFDATLSSTRWPRVRKYYRDLDQMLVLTAEDAEKFELEGFNNVGVMHNALSFYPEQVSDLTNPVVVAAGRYAWEKGYDRLIDAFALVADRHRDWSLKIFGHGPQESALRKQAERLGLADRIALPGLAGDIAAELRAASVFALSSIHEGLPMALAEAMACGLPCVAFDCAPGVREIVTDGVDGLVVPPRNVTALAEAMSKLMSDAELRRRFGQQARQNVRRFAPDTILAEWEHLFDLVER